MEDLRAKGQKAQVRSIELHHLPPPIILLASSAEPLLLRPFSCFIWKKILTAWRKHLRSVTWGYVDDRVHERPKLLRLSSSYQNLHNYSADAGASLLRKDPLLADSPSLWSCKMIAARALMFETWWCWEVVYASWESEALSKFEVREKNPEASSVFSFFEAVRHCV